MSAERVSTRDVMIAMRMADAQYDINFAVSGKLRGEIGRDGLPTFLSGKLQIDAGTIVDQKVPDYAMSMDRMDITARAVSGAIRRRSLHAAGAP